MLQSLVVMSCSVIFPTLGNRPWHLLHGSTDLASNPSCSKPPSGKKHEDVVTLPGQLCCPAFQDISWIFSLPYFGEIKRFSLLSRGCVSCAISVELRLIW